jgi:DNA polymerase-3 subunit beta
MFMKIRCSKSELVNGISIVSKAVPAKTTMPILECILIDAAGQTIDLVGNDMELGIRTTVAGEIDEKGIIAVDADIFSSIVRKLPETEISIEVKGEKVTITGEKARFDIPGKDGREFTKLPEIDKNEGITISQFTLKEMITKTIFSIAENESNKLMTGELMEISGGMLRMVSLDGHRISIRRCELNGSYSDRRVVIPGKTLSEVAKILGSDTEKIVNIFFTDKFVLFEFDTTTVVTRLIEDNYFRVDQMISNDFETHMTVNCREFMECVDRATLLVREGDKKPIILTISDTELVLRINTALGSMNEQLTVNKTGKDLIIGFNPKFLIDALRAIDDEEIDIYFLNSKAPCFIRDAGENYNYVVLPVNFITAE